MNITPQLFIQANAKYRPAHPLSKGLHDLGIPLTSLDLPADCDTILTAKWEWGDPLDTDAGFYVDLNTFQAIFEEYTGTPTEMQAWAEAAGFGSKSEDTGAEYDNAAMNADGRAVSLERVFGIILHSDAGLVRFKPSSLIANQWTGFTTDSSAKTILFFDPAGITTPSGASGMLIEPSNGAAGPVSLVVLGKQAVS